MANTDDLKAQVLQQAQSDPLRVYTLVQPGLNFTKHSHTHESGACPFHASTGKTPPFNLTTTGEHAGRWSCFGGCSKAMGRDVLDFAARSWGTAFPETLQRLSELLGLVAAPEVKRTAKPDDLGRLLKRTTWEGLDLEGQVVGLHHRADYEHGKRITWKWVGRYEGAEEGYPLSELRLYDPLPARDREAFAAEPVVIVEGEKAADSLYARGIVALGTWGANAMPSDAVLRPLAKRRVTVWADNDAGPLFAGQKHMDAIAQALIKLGGRVWKVEWPEAPPKGDAADFPGDADAINALLATATEVPRQWHPASVTVGREVIREKAGETEWLWQHRLPKGYLSCLGGATGIGKSTLMLYLCEAASGWSQWPNGDDPPAEVRPVIWLDGEARQKTVEERAEKLGLRVDLRFPGVDGFGSVDVEKPDGMAALRDMIERYEPALAVFDPWSGFQTRDHNSAEGNNLLKAIAELARDTNTAIIMVHDRRKEDREFGPVMELADIRGSGTLPQRAVSVMLADKPNVEDDAIRVRWGKANLTAIENCDPFGYLFDPSTGGLEWVEAPQPPRKETLTDLAQQWLTDFLRQGAQAEAMVYDVAAAKGHKAPAIRAARNNLRLVRWARDDGTTMWGLPEKQLQWAARGAAR